MRNPKRATNVTGHRTVVDGAADARGEEKKGCFL